MRKEQPMTTGPAVTGLISKEQAEVLTAEIRRACVEFVELRDHLQELIRQAHAGQIHNALGYASWTAWFADTVQIAPADKAQRQLWVAFMSGEGMSQRAIGKSLGVDQRTVSNDLRSGEENSSPDNVIGLDGKRYNPKRRQPIKSEVPPSDPTSELITLGRQVVSAVDKAAKLLHSFYDHPEYRARGAMDLDVDTALHHLANVAHKPEPQESPDAAINWDSLPGTAAKKLEVMRRQVRRELEAEFEDRVWADVNARVAGARNAMRVMQEQARKVLDSRKGIFTSSEWKQILFVAHPDTGKSVSDEHRANVFRLLNEADIVLLSEKDRPTPSPPLPSLDELRLRSAARKRR
jgi:hypothetical protein